MLLVRAVVGAAPILGTMFDTDRFKFIQRKAKGRAKRSYGLKEPHGNGKLQWILF